MWDAIRNRELKEEEGQCTWAARRGAFVMPMRTPFRSDWSRAAGQGVLQACGDGAYYSSSSMSNVPG